MDQENQAIEVLDHDAVRAITGAETDIQVRTAKQFPRDMTKSIDRCMALATCDEDTAGACLYALPRAGKKIEGGSIRLAEILAHAWGNLRVQTRIINVGATTVTAQAAVWDLESNVGISVEKQRRITNSSGQRFNDDMIVTTANAASSIALRDAVFRVVPKPLWEPIYEACKRKAIGDATTLVERRTSMLGSFAKMGVFADQILAAVEKSAIEEIGTEELAHLRGVFQAIKDGETSVDSAFPRPKEGDGAPQAATGSSKASKLGAAASRLKKDKDTTPPVEPATGPENEPEAKQEPEEPITAERWNTVHALYKALDDDQKRAARDRFNLGMVNKNTVYALGSKTFGEFESVVAELAGNP